MLLTFTIALLVIIYGLLAALTTYYLVRHRLEREWSVYVSDYGNEMRANVEREWAGRLKEAGEEVGATPGADLMDIIELAREQGRREAGQGRRRREEHGADRGAGRGDGGPAGPGRPGRGTDGPRIVDEGDEEEEAARSWDRSQGGEDTGGGAERQSGALRSARRREVIRSEIELRPAEFVGPPYSPPRPPRPAQPRNVAGRQRSHSHQSVSRQRPGPLGDRWSLIDELIRKHAISEDDLRGGGRREREGGQPDGEEGRPPPSEDGGGRSGGRDTGEGLRRPPGGGRRSPGSAGG